MAKMKHFTLALAAVFISCASHLSAQQSDLKSVEIVAIDFPETIVADTGGFSITDQGLVDEVGRFRAKDGNSIVRIQTRLNLPEAVTSKSFELRHCGQGTTKPFDFFLVLGADVEKDRYSLMGGVARASDNSEVWVAFTVPTEVIDDCELFVAEINAGRISAFRESQ